MYGRISLYYTCSAVLDSIAYRKVVNMKSITRILKSVICLFAVFLSVAPTDAQIKPQEKYSFDGNSELPLRVLNDCTTWSLSSDVRLYPNQENPNRDSCGNLSVWYFMGSHTLSHDPQGYYLLSNFAFDTKNIPGLQSWQGDNTEPTIPPNTKLPLIGINTTDLPQPNWPVNAAVVHPWKNTGMVIVGWRSPFTGVISIDGGVSDTDIGGGDGVDWFIDKGAAALASGGIYDGASQSFSDGTGGNALESIMIKQDEFVYFLIDPRANDGQDTTQLDILITLKQHTCEMPFFSQVDDNWNEHPLRTHNNVCSAYCGTIGHCGCTLTSAAMVFNTYGANTNPPQLSDCMNTSACPYAWATGATCSQGKAKWVSRPGFSWATLDQQLNQNHRPVLLGMCKKGTCQYDYDNDPETNSQTHWVVVLNGQGSDPGNYRIHDPVFKCGVNIPLSTRAGDWEFTWMGIYEGTVPCSSLTVLVPPCVSRGANPQPVQFNSGQSQNDSVLSSTISSSSVVSGTAWIYTRTELTMTVEITAASSIGNITDMLIWSDTMSNTTWQSFTPFVWLPVSDMVYASFRDNLGNITDIYSATINPIGPPNAPYQVFLPLVRR